MVYESTVINESKQPVILVSACEMGESWRTFGITNSIHMRKSHCLPAG